MGLFRPAIRLKRIPQADAELYIPSAWKNKVDNLSSNSDSQRLTRSKTTEISTTSSTSDDDFRIKYRTRKTVSNKTEKSSIKLRNHTTTKSHKKNDVVINYNSSTMLDQASLDDDSLTIPEDISPMDEDRILKDVIENNDNESIFASLDIIQDKPMENNSNHDMDDISNDRIESSPIQESDDDR